MARLHCKFTDICLLRCIVWGPHLFPLWSDSGTCPKASFIQTMTRVIGSLPMIRLRHATWEGCGKGDGTSCKTTKTKPAAQSQTHKPQGSRLLEPGWPSQKRDARKHQTLLCECSDAAQFHPRAHRCLRVDGDFPGGLALKNPPCNTRDMSLTPVRGTKIPHAEEQLSPSTITRARVLQPRHNWAK